MAYVWGGGAGRAGGGNKFVVDAFVDLQIDSCRFSMNTPSVSRHLVIFSNHQSMTPAHVHWDENGALQVSLSVLRVYHRTPRK